MKKIAPMFALLPALLVGCGMSESDKQQIAAVTCSVMGETRNMDAAVRVREMNAARVEIGEEPFLSGDEAIKESFKYGLCEQLVKNEPTYPELLSEMKRLEREAIAAKEKREREKAEREKREKEELERVAREKWREAIASDLTGVSLRLISASYSTDIRRFTIKYPCSPIEGFRWEIVVVLKDNVGTLKNDNEYGTCWQGESNENFVRYSRLYDDDIAEVLYDGASNVIKLIDEIYVLIYGVHEVSPRDRMRKLDPKEYPPLGKRASLKNPIRIDVKM